MRSYLAIKAVKPLDDYKLALTFANGERLLFDMKPYLNKGIYRQLRDVKLFSTAHVSFDTAEWDNEAYFDPEALYEGSEKINEKEYRLTLTPRASAAKPRVRSKKKSNK
ncbi:MAG: DUF2442 domain-containing protein [Chitinophagales bacterium]|nr:DUF2442 domain-containing protein [Chitinophagales bacterium]